ncbi:MAG: hypothetical protein QME64_02885, partial [bacterium]|nr:hypothetical protein [bacterium]
MLDDGSQDAWWYGYVDLTLNIEPSYSLTVNSYPDTDVYVAAYPSDNFGNNGGNASFVLTYTKGTTVALIAPIYWNGKIFEKWTKDGCDSSTTPMITLNIDTDYMIIASYSTKNLMNNYGAFTSESDTTYWLFEKYGDGTSAGTLSWISTYQCIAITQTPGQKAKFTQLFSVPSTG